MDECQYINESLLHCTIVYIIVDSAQCNNVCLFQIAGLQEGDQVSKTYQTNVHSTFFAKNYSVNNIQFW